MLGISALGQLALAEFPQAQKQIVGAILSGRRRKPQTLAEFEAEQPKPFGRKWFAEFKAAEQAARESRPEKKAARKAIQRAVETAAEVRRGLDLAPPTIDLEPLTKALDTVSQAKKVEETVRAARQAESIARAVLEIMRKAQEDEDDAVTLLLLS